jgi:hypothetical protein
MTNPGSTLAVAAWRELLDEAATRFKGCDDVGAVGVVTLLRDNLTELTGIPQQSCVSVALRGGTILIVRKEFHLLTATDQAMDIARVESNWEEDVYRGVVSSASWLREKHQNRIVCFETDRAYELAIVALNVYLDIRQRRDLRLLASSVPSVLLHDVLATLHGCDRRVAGLVCRAWAAVSCDPMLPVDKSDVTAWLAPRVVEVQRALPTSFPLTTYSAVTAWAWTRHWLGGGE